VTVSVVTIAWHNEGFSNAFTDSLVAAAARSGEVPELIVVVNGPDGEAAGAAVRAACKGTVLVPIVVPLDRNTGFSGGADAGVDRANGDVIVVANLDVFFDDCFLEVVEREATTAAWDLLAPRVAQGPDRQDCGVSRRRRCHRLAWVLPPSPGTAVPAGNGACIVLRRSALEQRQADSGALFDPEFHSFNEDIDLYWWVERAGLVVRYAPEARVAHALAGSFDGRHRFEDRPVDVQRRVMANYRVTVWKNAERLRDWLGWPLGELEYLAQVTRARGPRGIGAYLASWPLAITTARAIRTRTGRLRPRGLGTRRHPGAR
jgi:GT2 family glycosyltransferase